MVTFSDVIMSESPNLISQNLPDSDIYIHSGRMSSFLFTIVELSISKCSESFRNLIIKTIQGLKDATW